METVMVENVSKTRNYKKVRIACGIKNVFEVEKKAISTFPCST